MKYPLQRTFILVERCSVTGSTKYSTSYLQFLMLCLLYPAVLVATMGPAAPQCDI